MENLRIFENPEFGQVRTKLDNKGMSWFVGKDVAEALGYKNSSDAVYAHVDEEDKTSSVIYGAGSKFKAKTTLINESGLYSLILSSKLPSAKRFKHWVTSVVLPQIRKTGGYIPLEDGDSEKEVMLKSLDIAKKTLAAREAELEAQKPAVQFAKAITECDNDILIRDLAKFLTQNGVKIGPMRLFYWLRKHHYIYQNETRPYQKYVERGIFRINASLISTQYGYLENVTTRVTGRGQKYFLNGFLSGRFNASDKALQPKDYDLFYSCRN